ncbi:MAG: hypothetical protein FWD60_07940 [Candidatus Azobacteroides sp.]|nr:hypothetical protein [Candidatus Azobacteroides sp.]
MKTNKLSAIEKLQIKRACLKAEEQSQWNELNKQVDYLQSHWGSLLINSGIDAVKSNFLGIKNSRKGRIDSSKNSAVGFFEKHPYISSALIQLVDIVPMFMKGRKAMIAAFVLRSAKDFIISKKQIN